jgi:hypothetical protein
MPRTFCRFTSWVTRSRGWRGPRFTSFDLRPPSPRRGEWTDSIPHQCPIPLSRRRRGLCRCGLCGFEVTFPCAMLLIPPWRDVAVAEAADADVLGLEHGLDDGENRSRTQVIAMAEALDALEDFVVAQAGYSCALRGKSFPFYRLSQPSRLILRSRIASTCRTSIRI